MGKAPSKSSSNKIINLDEQEMAVGKQNKRAACPKDKLEFTFFKPCYATLVWSTGLDF